MISIRDSWIRALADPSENVKHYYNILIVIVFFFVAQLLIYAWDQPFWSAGVEFPGQIVAMLFVWLTIWAVQLLFCVPGQGVDKFYHKFLRVPVSVSLLCVSRPCFLEGNIYVLTLVFGRRRSSTSTCPLASQCHS